MVSVAVTPVSERNRLNMRRRWYPMTATGQLSGAAILHCLFGSRLIKGLSYQWVSCWQELPKARTLPGRSYRVPDPSSTCFSMFQSIAVSSAGNGLVVCSYSEAFRAVKRSPVIFSAAPPSRRPIHPDTALGGFFTRLRKSGCLAVTPFRPRDRHGWRNRPTLGRLCFLLERQAVSGPCG